ncbi:BTAD domain-containing putative transcriptional regulator [Streptomyces sp. NPDC058371]|uniref:BTAD domain-containing putative transcriptional regulator n=1 Tax=Streptomyces sp. NPDC058371 TaxID=3346463 RepID=UPI0036586105
MRFGILGPLDIRTEDGTPLDPGGPRPRALLTLLLLDAGRTVPTERLTDGLYGDRPPAGAANALQSQISRLRRRLGPHAEVATSPAGYRIAVSPDSVDAHRFERLARDGHTALTRGDPAQAATLLREALALWRGPALIDLPDARAHVTRLEELRLTAVQDRVDADLALGGGPELVPELRALIGAHPLSERLYGQLMRALHAGGRPAEALSVYEQARRTLADELGADPSPELSALHVELLRGAGPAGTTERRPPAQLTRFIGRDTELRRIRELLVQARLVTLTGPGGAGRTRLAIEVAHSHVNACASVYGGSVCYVELAPLTDGSQVPYAVLAALGVRDGFRGPATDTTERLFAALEDRELLLVLDNCEHLIEDVARTAVLLLGACPGVRILATGRESLGITGEELCPVPPLPPEPAARLFLDRAAAVRPGFEGHARVADICAALDGLPLAIELAAARLRTLTPDELADRLGAHLDDRFRLLSRGDRTKAPRHRTLRAVVEWSWDLLDEEERELARRLTVFSGGATAEAVEAVCGVPYPEDVLASLVEKSFLEVTEGRYGMLRTIHAFAAEHLARTDEEDGLRDVHARYFRRLAERAEPFLRGGDQLPWLALLTAEQGNLDSALRHLVRTDPHSALRLMAELSWFWRLRGLYGAHVPLARALLAAVGDEPPEGLAEEYVLCAINAVSGDGAGGDPADRNRLARVETTLAALEGPLRLPFTVVLWSVAGGPQPVADERVRAQVGDGAWGRALLDVGTGYQEQFTGRPEAAAESFARALEGFRATGDRWGMANCLDPLGMWADWRGEHDRALALLDEGLAYVRELAAPEETADLLRIRATVLLHRGELTEAAAHFARALPLARTAGAPDKVASARRGLGDAARLSGDTAHARVQYESALEACAANWFSIGESVRILIGLGRTALAEGDADAARDWFRQAAALAVESPGTLELADAAEALACVADSPERAAVLLGAAVALRGAALQGDPEAVRTAREIRAAVSSEAYEKAFAQGRRLGAVAVTEGTKGPSTADSEGRERPPGGRSATVSER